MKPYKALILVLMGLLACTKTYTPKPKGYHKIDFPKERIYKGYDNSVCPFDFEVPQYVTVERDSLYFNEDPEHPCWLNVRFDNFDATIHMSYKTLDKHGIITLLEDMHKMTFKHAIKAEYIDDQYLETDNGVFGLRYIVGGNAASPMQFFVTDSVSHFIRGALYFNCTPNADSLKPVFEYIMKDVDHLITSLRWKS